LYNEQFDDLALIELDASNSDLVELPEGFVISVGVQSDLWLIKNLFEAEYHY
jgi:hypothetical protein